MIAQVELQVERGSRAVMPHPYPATFREGVKKPAAKRARSKPADAAAAAAEGDEALAVLPEKVAKAPRKFKEFVPTGLAKSHGPRHLLDFNVLTT